MKKKIAMISAFLLFSCFFTFASAKEQIGEKKVISIVYDDSGSMMMNNKYCYSDYALQILTAMLGQNDELNIVKMSEYYKNNEVNLAPAYERQNYINEIQKYEYNAGTPFEAVTTAKNWLVQKSDSYKEDAEYWLVVITDGVFAGLPQDVNSYIEDLNKSFNNLNFEFIFLSIGSENDFGIKDAVRNSANSTVIEAIDSESIYSSLMEISKMINSGATDKIVNLEKKRQKTIKLTSNYPLKKMMILLQNNDNFVTAVKYQNKNLNTETFSLKYDTESLKGNLTHVLTDANGFLNSGEYTIEFDKDVELNKDVNFLCEGFVLCEITAVNKENKTLTNAQVNFLTKDDNVRIKCEIFNAADKSKLKDANSNFSAELNNNKNKYNMIYDEKTDAYYADISLVDDNNNIYAVVEAPDLFRIKSNVILIDTILGKANLERYKNELAEIEVPYSSGKEYKGLTQFIFKFMDAGDMNLARNFELELIDIPKGIKIEYGGKEYKNGDRIPMVKEVGKEYKLNILVNKDYTDTEETIVTLKLLSDEEGMTIYWDSTGFDEEYIKFKPKAYPIKIINKNNDYEIDVQNEKLILSLIRVLDESENAPVIGYVSTEDIKKIFTNTNFTNGFTYKIKKNDVNNTLEITIKPNIFALFGKETANVNIEALLNNELEKGTYKEEISVTNVSVWLILKPYVFIVILIIIALGYVVKKKFNKKSQISITEGNDRVSYALKPEMSTLLLPFVSHKTKRGVIEFKAGKGNDIVFSGRSLNIIRIDAESFDEYMASDNVNLDRIVMKKDLSSVTVEAFDVTQKYEYLSKEIEIEDYDDSSFSDEYTDGGEF